MSIRTSSFPSCFHPPSAAETHHLPADPPPIAGNPNLATSLYRTDAGLFSLTWSRSVLGRSLHLLLLHDPLSLSSPPTLSFHIHIKPFFFWRKHGSKNLNASPKVQIFWDLSTAKFGSQPDPQSGFYIAVVVDGEMTLVVGDLVNEAYRRTKTRKLGKGKPQVLVLRREHVFGTQVYTTKAKFGGKSREISVDCSVDSDPKLNFSVDNKTVLQIKRLKWKFRGNERVEVDGVAVQISWDVYNWLFEDNNNHKHAVFIFGFEKLNEEDNDEKDVNFGQLCDKNEMVVWGQQGCSGGGGGGGGGLGMNGVELKKLRKKMTTRSSSLSLSSVSSASSSCSSSVMEWASSEENELSSSPRFSLLVYAWRR